MINDYILFIFSLFTICPIFTLVFFIMNKKEHLRYYCIARMSDAVCDAIFFSPSLVLFSFINKPLTEKDKMERSAVNRNIKYKHAREHIVKKGLL